jgi:hypothetical protein
MTDLPETTMELAIECRLCKKEYTIYGIKPADYESWSSGAAFIQDVMPYLLPWERELMISATCDECWQSMFGHIEIKMESDLNE